MRAHDYARLLRDAWNRADSRQILCVMEEVRAAAVDPRSAESERMELIHQIGRVMRQSMAGDARQSDLAASLDLLRHLADSQGC